MVVLIKESELINPLNKFMKGKYWLAIVATTASIATGMGLVVGGGSLAQAAERVATTTGVTQMNIWQAIVLGIVQGLTEFLPISSTAHLKVIPVALGWGDPGVGFTAVIQLGSIAAVLWYFWADIQQIILGAIAALVRAYQRQETAPTPMSLPEVGQVAFQESQDLRIAVGIFLGTLPIVFFGLLIKVLIPDFDNSPLRSLPAIALASIVMAIFLGLAEKLGKRELTYEKLGTKTGIIMGLAQAMALVPGVSRSGSTLTAGLFMGIERAAAARFSFLLGIPAITLAGLVELKGVITDPLLKGEILPLAIGTISAAIFSYGAIAWLLGYLKKQSTWVFIWYRLVFGILILWFTR